MSKIVMKGVRVFLVLLALAVSSSPVDAEELQVFAAVSLTDALKEIALSYDKETGNRLIFNFAASNVLARQIQEGAPADLFFSADEEKMDSLEKAGLILKETRKSLLSNTLVIVVPLDSSISIDSPLRLAKENWRIAMGDPQSVPAGIYAKAYLTKIGIWTQVQDRVIPTENVRAALAAVESGNVDVGIVYKTDASISKEVKIGFEISSKEGPGISYTLAVISESRKIAMVRRLADYLASRQSIAVFRKYGFLIKE